MLSITYDLRGRHADYEGLTKCLRELGAFRALDSTWLLATKKSPLLIRTILGQFTDPDDGILIIQVGADSSWCNLNPEANLPASG